MATLISQGEDSDIRIQIHMGGTLQPERIERIKMLLNEVDTCHDELVASMKAEELARSARTDCLNRANRAQKALDEELTKLRLDAPHGSDWQKSQG